MKPLVPVSQIMTRNVIKLNIDDSLPKAEQLFKTHKIRHIPVTSGTKVVGILSNADLLRAAQADFSDDDTTATPTRYHKASVQQVMTKEVTTVLSYTSIKEVAEIFVASEFRALPVVYEDRLVGIVTTTDIIRYLLAHYQ